MDDMDNLTSGNGCVGFIRHVSDYQRLQVGEEEEQTFDCNEKEEVYEDNRPVSQQSIIDDDLESETNQCARPRENESLEDLYRRTCKKFKVVPCSPFIRQMHLDEVNLSHYNIGPNGSKALAEVLKRNTIISLLDVSDNGIEVDGTIALSVMLMENVFITVLDISMNFIGQDGAKAIYKVLCENKFLLELSLASNKLSDKSASFISDALKQNTTLRMLDLSDNAIGEPGGVQLADAVKCNSGLFYLNLSGNHIRNKGAAKLLDSMISNSTLRSLMLSRNGFADNISDSIRALLETNSTLRELDLSYNRLSIFSATNLSAGLERNKGLQILKLGANPLSSAGCKMIIDALIVSTLSKIEELYLDRIPVSLDFQKSLEDLIAINSRVIVEYGTVISGKNHKWNIQSQKDLVSRILDFIEYRGIRMLDFFRLMDRSCKMMITKSEFKRGLQIAGIPMRPSYVDKLFQLLDSDGKGFAEYKDFTKVLQKDFHGAFAKSRNNNQWNR